LKFVFYWKTEKRGMGFIGDIINRAHAKAEQETEGARAKILSAHDLRSASQAMYEAMKNCSGHSAKSALIACFQERIRDETNVVNRYAAFEEMYRLYKESGDATAMNIAQILGECPIADAAP